MTAVVRPLADADWDDVRRIYLEGIATGQATFETEAPAWERWDAGHRRDCRLGAVEGGRLVGWAALSPVSAREAYGGVGEVSVYGARARCRRDASSGSRRGVRGGRPLDAPGEHLPGKRLVPSHARETRVPQGGTAGAHRTPPRNLEGHGDPRTTQRPGRYGVNGSGRSSSYSRIFLALGSLVAGAALFRLARAAFVARGVLARIPDTARRAGLDARLFLALAMALAVVVAVSAGAIRRRPWARLAAIALLAAGAAAGSAVAVLQAFALARGADRTPEAAEIGYGVLLSYWRIAAVAVGILAAAFCAAGLRRLTSEDTKRQFETGGRTPTG